jgi:MoaA/NifB/PqqE/SkfB family radical SAM enzyme
MSAESLAIGQLSDIAPSHEIVSLPILILNVHENCNCKCSMCDIWKRPAGTELSLEAAARYQSSIRSLNVRQVVLTGGEPLLHSGFHELCELLKRCGVRITLLSTGLLLKKQADAIADYVDEIIISIDGPEEVHDRIRGVRGAYRLIEQGVSELRSKRARLPVLGRSTVQRANHHLLRQTVAAAKKLGLNSISFLAADLTSQAFNRELVWPGERQSEIALTHQEIDALEREIDALLLDNSRDIQDRYIVESPAKLYRISRRFREQLGEVAPASPRCNAPWVSAVLEVDGSVRPCFFHKKVGNALDHGLEAVLNGKEALEFRASLNVATNRTCQRCVCSLFYSSDLLDQPKTG